MKVYLKNADQELSGILINERIVCVI